MSFSKGCDFILLKCHDSVRGSGETPLPPYVLSLQQNNVAGRHVIRFRSEGDAVSLVQSIATDVRTPYFVKPTGDNAADGKSYATARKTLKGALEIPGLVAGDIIYVAPGVYAEDAMWDGCNSNRAIVATGLGLDGYAGPEETFIKGCYATTDTKCGPDAVRCANVKRGAFVRGFTLYNGATASNVTETLKHPANNSGGNAFVEAGGALIDCVVSNGVAFYRGGGCGSVEAAAGDYIRCRFTNGVGVGLRPQIKAEF